MAVHLIYETHSTTVDSKRGPATGWLPGALSVSGREWAARLGRRHAPGRVDVISTADLWRAVETVAIAFADHDVPVIQDSRSRECDYGELNSQPVVRVAAEHLRRIDTPIPGGQSYRGVVAAMASCLNVLQQHDGRTVAVVASSANRCALDLLLPGVPLERSVLAPDAWQPGWVYGVPAGFDASPPVTGGGEGP